MKAHSRMLPLVVGALLVSSAAPAVAQLTSNPGNLDHLICYKMKDKTDISSTLDLRAELQPEFTQAGCRIIRPFEFCVPATKMNVSPPPAQPGLSGQPLRDDYICYLIKCPKPVAPDRFVADQFGRRLQEKYKPFKVCVPARKAPPPCGPQNTARQCGGVCPAGSGPCRFDTTAKLCTCDPPMQCDGSKPDAAGTCGGPCPPNTICQPVLEGTDRICRCRPVEQPCEGSTAGACGGTCDDPAAHCVFVPTLGECRCQPPDGGCVKTAAGQCTGTCTTNPSLACVLDPLTNECRCDTPPQPCGHNPFNGQCGGTCPAPEVCRFINTGTAAICQCAP